MGLLLLATEILIEILLYLDVPDAYAIQSVNHFLNDIYKVSLELQYALACKVAYVRDNPHCHLPIEDRLRKLRDREATWR
jgi:3-methyladenine DNA glycosylase AlkC